LLPDVIVGKKVLVAMDEKKLVVDVCRVWRRNLEVWVFCAV